MWCFWRAWEKIGGGEKKKRKVKKRERSGGGGGVGRRKIEGRAKTKFVKAIITSDLKVST